MNSSSMKVRHRLLPLKKSSVKELCSHVLKLPEFQTRKCFSGAYGKEQSNSVSLDSGMKSKQKQHRQSPVDLDSLGFSWIGLQNDQEFFGRRARHKEIE